jgi:hypothetical protein
LALGFCGRERDIVDGLESVSFVVLVVRSLVVQVRQRENRIIDRNWNQAISLSLSLSQESTAGPHLILDSITKAQEESFYVFL